MFLCHARICLLWESHRSWMQQHQHDTDGHCVWSQLLVFSVKMNDVKWDKVEGETSEKNTNEATREEDKMLLRIT